MKRIIDLGLEGRRIESAAREKDGGLLFSLVLLGMGHRVCDCRRRPHTFLFLHPVR
jgi:hypothetical protein